MTRRQAQLVSMELAGGTPSTYSFSLEPPTTPQGRQGIKGVVAPDRRSIRSELWFARPDTTAHEQRLPIILVRADLDSTLVAILSEAKVR